MAGRMLALVAALASLCSLVLGHNVNYVITTPKVVRPGLPFTFSVALTENAAATTVTAQMNGQSGAIGSPNVQQLGRGESKSFSMAIPVDLVESSVSLSVTGTGGVTISQRVSLSVESRSSIVLIQTDKAVYKPGDEVKYRTVLLNPDLKPKLMAMEVSIKDPQANKLSVQKVEPGQLTQGVHNGSLQLSEFPVEGEWTIHVEAGNIEQEKKFQVEEYVLPKYEVKVDMPKYYIEEDNKLMITVTAKYTYGKPVKGQARIQLMLDQTKQMHSGELTNGKYVFAMDKDELRALYCKTRHCETGSHDDDDDVDEEEGIDGRRPMVPVDIPWYGGQAILKVTANVTETLTGKNFSETGQCTLYPQSLTGDIKGPSTFKSNMPYSAMVELTGPGGEGPPRSLLDSDGYLLEEYRNRNLELSVRMSYNRVEVKDDGTRERISGSNEVKLSVPFDRMGCMPFTLDIDEKFETITIQATEGRLSLYKTINEFESRDEQSLMVSLPDLTGKVKGDSVKFIAKSTTPITELYVVVISKGVIVSTSRESFAATTEYVFNYAVDKAKLAPSAKLLIYTLSSDGEIIPDYTQFEVDGLFSNEVTVAFDKDTAQPGNDITLSVQASPDSFVAVLAVDMSVQLLGSGNDITEDMVMTEVEKFDTKTGGGIHPWMDGRRKRSIWCPYCWGNDDTDAQSLFRTVGVNILSDAYIHSGDADYRDYLYLSGPRGGGDYDFNAGPEMYDGDEGMQDEKDVAESSPSSIPKTRTLFPETWLWTDEIVGSDGSTTIETKVPDTITSWIASAFAVHEEDGFGLSEEPASVQVSKDFFVSLTLPYSVIRGEEFKLQILVFNYKQTSLSVDVELVVNDHFKVKDVVGNYKRTVEVPANDAMSLEPWIIPSELGQIDIEVRAISSIQSDAVLRKLLVEPECVLETYSEAQLLDLDTENPEITFDFMAKFPDNLVEGSEYITVTLAGDLMGPSISGLESLIRMPTGCGEQNMITFVPNIYALNYMEAASQDSAKVRADAMKYMTAGYQRELNYRRNDNSFSAFGDNDQAGSTWLTAFVVKSFRQAKDYIYVDDEILRKSLNWLQLQYDKSERSFSEPPNGRVIHTEMQGGTAKGVALTAYVVLAFLENKELMLYSWNQDIEGALDHLEEQLTDLKDPLPIALITYTLHMAERSDAAERAFTKLWDMRIEKDGHVYWAKAEDEKKDEEMDVMPFWYRRQHSTSSSIEMTSYALLTIAYRVNKKIDEDITVGLKTMKYLASQRNDRGGFHSTQDTVMALYALSEYATLVNSDDQNIAVSLKAGKMDYKFDTITKETGVILQRVEIPAKNASVIEVKASGKGSALVQLNVRYHACDSDPVPGVIINVGSTVGNTNVVSTHICASWTKEEASGMFLFQMALLSSYEVLDLKALKMQYAKKGLKRVEMQGNDLVLYFDEVTMTEMCFDVKSAPTVEVVELQAAAVAGFSYYSPQVRAVQMYLPEGMPTKPTTEPIPDLGNQVVASIATIIMAAVVAMAALF